MSRHEGTFSSVDRNVRELLAALCDGTITPQQSGELELALTRDEAARVFYLAHMQVQADIQWRHRGADELAQEVGDTSGNTVHVRHATTAGEPLAERIPNVWHQAKHWLGSPVGGGIATATVVTILFIVVAANIMLSKPVPEPDGPRVVRLRPAHQPQSVATLKGVRGVRWEDGKERDLDSSFLAGERIALIRGVATIEFSSGAVTVLRGPCVFEIIAPREGNLRRGWLRADVPPKAVGFTVETPSARIVDMGTSFEVDVGRDGITLVNVLDGKVLTQPLDTTGDPFGEPVLLTKGGSAKLDAISLTAQVTSKSNTTKGKPQYLLPLDWKVTNLVAPVDVTASTSEYPAANLINGSGLADDGDPPGPSSGDGLVGTGGHLASGEDHDARGTAALPSAVAWRSRSGSSATLTFDMGSSVPLGGTHIWQYNDGYSAHPAGAKNIVISTSSDGDQYEEVTQVSVPRSIESDKAGRPHSDQTKRQIGTSFLFNKVAVARYVRFEIRNNHGEASYVGLSEIRFIRGKEPVDPQKIAQRLKELEEELREVRAARGRQLATGKPIPKGLRTPRAILQEIAELRQLAAAQEESKK